MPADVRAGAARLFRGGSVFDGHRHRPGWALLVDGGRVRAVGPQEQVETQAPRGTEAVDLAGGLVLPGFVDAHVHAVQGGLERLRCDLSEAAGLPALQARVAAYAAENPPESGAGGPDGWVLGGGWAMADFPGGLPTAAVLDAVLPDRPAFLVNRDHHGAWVNTAALVLASIDADTPDPDDGRIERDERGQPTGCLHEGAMALVGRLLPAVGDAEADAALDEAQSYLHSLGVTGWQDAIFGDYAGTSDPAPAYLRAAQDGRLLSHVVGALWWDRDRGVEQVPGLVARRAALEHGRLSATSVKIMADGVAENFTAAMSEPYVGPGGRACGCGHSFVPRDALAEAVAALEAERFQVHVHAIGDRAVRDTLDAFEGALARRDSSVPDGAGGTAYDLRHHVAHLQVVDPHDLPRFGALGVAANAQALWACLDPQMVELTLPFLGERGSWQYPFGGIHAAGGRVVCGSDWPVSTPDPLAALHVAVHRTDPDERDAAPFLPEQALGLEAAFAAYTSGSAWICHRDDAGELRPDAVADLAVLDRDPFSPDVASPADCRVVSTWVDGVRVYGDGN